LPNCKNLECLPLPFTSTLDLYLQERLEPTKVEPVMVHPTNGMLQELPAMAIVNTRAYYDTVTITAVKSFIAQSPQ
jgi:hypothetical protein